MIWTRALGLCVLMGCATPHRGSGPLPARGDSAVDGLTLPPSHDTENTWRRLAASPRCDQRWTALRYLLDLRDLAWALSGMAADHGRRARDDAATLNTRRVLSRLLGHSGDSADGAAVDAELEARLKSFARRCARATSLVRAVRALLDADATPRLPLARSLAAVVAYKHVMRDHQQLAPNARLRLIRWCSAAFHRAVRAEPSHQQGILNDCLFPLFEADPRPYFRDDPTTRPPDPPWPLLRARLRAETDRLKLTRLSHYARRQSLATHQLLEQASARLPSGFGPRAFELPPSDAGQAMGRIPVVAVTPAGYVVDNQAVGLDDAEALESAIARRRAGDGPSGIAVICREKTSLRRIFAIGRAAHRAAVQTLYLGVRRRVAENPPEGDVQAAMSQDAAVWRLEGLPLSLRLLGSKQRGAPPRERAKALGYDARQATMGLALSLRPGRYQLSSVDGTLPTTNLAGLAPLLLTTRRAYPLQMALILAAAEGVSYGELVEVVRRTRFHDHEPLFPGLALTRLYRVRRAEADISALLAALAQSRVSATPPAGASIALLEGAHRCYRSALRRAFSGGRRWPEGRALLSHGRPPRLKARGLRDGQMMRCLEALVAHHPSAETLPLTLYFARRSGLE